MSAFVRCVISREALRLNHEDRRHVEEAGTSVTDLPTEPKRVEVVGSVGQERTIIVAAAIRLPPLGDCLYAHQPTIPQLTSESAQRSDTVPA